LVGPEAAILNESEREDGVFASRLEQMRETYRSRRQELLRSISLLDEDFSRSKAALKQEFHEAQLAREKRWIEVRAYIQKRDTAKAFAKVPAEILGYIFEECVEGDLGGMGGEGLGTSPWLLALVCRFWCQTAMGTPSLWRKILVTDYPQVYWTIKRNDGLHKSIRSTSASVRSHSAMQVCLNRTELARTLERTGIAPLEITLAICGKPNSNATQHNRFYKELYLAIFNEHVAGRISRLVAENNPWPLYTLDVGTISDLYLTLSKLISLEIHSLKAFSIMLGDDESMFRLILTNAKDLRTLRVGTGGTPDLLSYHSWRGSSYTGAIANLKELRVSENLHLDAILSGPVDLEVLIIDAAARVEIAAEVGRTWEETTYPWPNVQTPEIAFLRLARVHLILDDFSLLDRLKFPVLEELRLTQSSVSRRSSPFSNETMRPPNDPDFILDLPRLRALRVTSPQIALMNRFIMPQLEDLHITSTCVIQTNTDADFAAFISVPTAPFARDPIPDVPPSDSLQSILHLHINATLSEKGMVRILRAFPSLQTLHLVPGRKIGKFSIKALTIGRHKRHTEMVYCSHLKVIELDCYSFMGWDKAQKAEKRVGTIMPTTIPGLMEKCMKSRKQWGEPLDRYTITTPEGTKLEYVAP
jgi:hypothetical protein